MAAGLLVLLLYSTHLIRSHSCLQTLSTLNILCGTTRVKSENPELCLGSMLPKAAVVEKPPSYPCDPSVF